MILLLYAVGSIIVASEVEVVVPEVDLSGHLILVDIVVLQPPHLFRFLPALCPAALRPKPLAHKPHRRNVHEQHRPDVHCPVIVIVQILQGAFLSVIAAVEILGQLCPILAERAFEGHFLVVGPLEPPKEGVVFDILDVPGPQSILRTNSQQSVDQTDKFRAESFCLELPLRKRRVARGVSRCHVVKEGTQGPHVSSSSDWRFARLFWGTELCQPKSCLNTAFWVQSGQVTEDRITVVHDQDGVDGDSSADNAQLMQFLQSQYNSCNNEAYVLIGVLPEVGDVLRTADVLCEIAKRLKGSQIVELVKTVFGRV